MSGTPTLGNPSEPPRRLRTVYNDGFARAHCTWRPVVAQADDTFLGCGILEHGFAHIRCDDCAHAHLFAFSCKRGYLCPSCHANCLAIWTQWLGTTLLVPRAALARRAHHQEAGAPVLSVSLPSAR